MQDYIAGHLSEKITLCDLSRAAGYSPFYCARIFKELTGLAPADYIRRLRLSGSALRLRDEQRKVIDIAYDFGYDSVDGYQRAFRNAFGCNPYEYAKSPITLPLFTPYGVKFKTLWKEQKSMEHIANVSHLRHGFQLKVSVEGTGGCAAKGNRRLITGTAHVPKAIGGVGCRRYSTGRGINRGLRNRSCLCDSKRIAALTCQRHHAIFICHSVHKRLGEYRFLIRDAVACGFCRKRLGEHPNQQHQSNQESCYSFYHG